MLISGISFFAFRVLFGHGIIFLDQVYVKTFCENNKTKWVAYNIAKTF